MEDWKVVKLFCVADSSLLPTLLNLTCTTLEGEEAKVSLTSLSKSCVIDDHPCPVKHLRKSNQVSIEEKKSCLTVSNTILGRKDKFYGLHLPFALCPMLKIWLAAISFDLLAQKAPPRCKEFFLGWFMQIMSNQEDKTISKQQFGQHSMMSQT